MAKQSTKPAKRKKKTATRRKPVVILDYSKPLTNPRYEQFCQAYMVTNNATQAAKDAKYSEKTAKTKGNQLLSIVDIRNRLSHLQDRLAEKCGVTVQMLMEEWKKIGFANIKGIVGTGNKIRNISGLTDEVTAGIASVATSKTSVKVTMHSKETALEHMGKMIGAYEKDQAPLVDALANLMKEIGNNGSGLPIKT